MPKKSGYSGMYQSKNQIITYITSGSYDRIDLYSKAIVKDEEITKTKGFTDFSVAKYNCGTMLVNNI
jgi:hypothetical protein